MGSPVLLVVTVSALATTPVERIRIRLPARLRPILLVRPSVEQFWIDDFSPEAIVSF
jgi:hypothetical protein